jgi:hypothetical protein
MPGCSRNWSVALNPAAERWFGYRFQFLVSGHFYR